MDDDTRFVARLRADHPHFASVRLTDAQQGALAALADAPYPGGGWHCGSPAKTARLLDGLVRKGLARLDGRVYRPEGFVRDVHDALAREASEAITATHAARDAARAVELARGARVAATLRAALAAALAAGAVSRTDHDEALGSL